MESSLVSLLMNLHQCQHLCLKTSSWENHSSYLFSNALEKILTNYKNEEMIENDHSISSHEENNEKLDDSCDECKEENNIL